MAETVNVPIPKPEPAPAAAPTAPVEPSAEVIEAKVRERYKADFGVEDPTEIKRWKEAADELPRARQALDHVMRRPPPAVAQPPEMSQEEFQRIEELGRIHPVRAYMLLEQFREKQREHQRTQDRQQQVAMTGAAMAYERDASEARSHLQKEYPEVFDEKSDFQREAVTLYNSSPYYQQTGQGMRLAAEIVAARKGILPKSMRAAAQRAAVPDQEPERGTRRPPRNGDSPTEIHFTDKEKRMAKDMGLDANTFRESIRARRGTKNIKAE